MKLFSRLSLVLILLSSLSFSQPSTPAQPTFKTVVYIPVGTVLKMKDRRWLESSWAELSSQVKVDKVYIETYRSRVMADAAVIEDVKKFFTDRHVEIAGGICFSDDDNGQFVSFVYSRAEDRAYVKQVSEFTARHFDEIILDDFFFSNTKKPSDIAARGTQSWTDYRLKTMDDVSRELVVGAAKAVNPKAHVIIKFPNWYEHFRGNGYDLAAEPTIYDGIYAGTETRDSVITDQNLQPYESYLIMRYFDEIAPNRNGGGWVDTYDIRYIDRYSEQLWLTVFGKAREMTLFNYDDLLKIANPGTRPWQNLSTNVDMKRVTRRANSRPPTYAAVAGDALDQIRPFVGRLGNPIGIAAYHPLNALGEDFLHNFIGNIGIPLEMVPTYPKNADVVFLNEGSTKDPDLLTHIKQSLHDGHNVVMTQKAWARLEGHGGEDLVELRYTDRKVPVSSFIGAFGPGAGTSLGHSNTDILISQVRFLTNDAWPVIRAIGHDNGFPLLLMDQYDRGILYVLVVPENFADLYALPQPVLDAIRSYVLGNFPVRIEAPAKVDLFAYDNGTFIIQSFRDEPVEVTVLATAKSTSLTNIVTNESISGTARKPRHPAEPATTAFKLTIQPHSYQVLQTE